MANEHPEETSDETSFSKKDWDKRTLCSDGNCIGVIGADGLCKECGKSYDGSPVEDSVFEEDMPDEEDEIVEDEQQEDADGLGWENRQLCSDGNCIGVIGSDGRCKECGKAFEGGQQQEIPTEQEIPAEQDMFDAETEPWDDEEAESQTDIDWENRTLCVDESCIGVIGPDGRCKECGKPFES